MTTVLRLLLVDAVAHPMRELARRQLGRVDLLDMQLARVAHRFEVDARSPRVRSNSRPSSSSKMNIAAFSPRCDRRDRRIDREQAILPVPAGPRISVLDPLLDPAAEQGVELGDAAGDAVAREAACGARRRPGAGTPHAAGLDGEVVVAAAETRARDT